MQTREENHPVERLSIYYLHDKPQKSLILLAGAMIAIITPFTDTIYLPALKELGTSLNASDSSVSATISAYLGGVGLGQLIWGPISDYYGRSVVLFWGLVVYEAFTIGCIFVENINDLIVLRTMQGLIIGSSVVTVQAIIADVFPEEDRGQAMGSFLVCSVDRIEFCCTKTGCFFFLFPSYVADTYVNRSYYRPCHR